MRLTTKKELELEETTKTLVLTTIIDISMLVVGCASYQDAQATTAQYDKDGKAVPGDYRVESVFKF